MTSEQIKPVHGLLMSKILLARHELDHIQASHLVPRLAMNLAMRMPEYFPGEHLQTAQIIATGTANVMIPECLKLIFYRVSNNMARNWNADDFENLYTILSRTGLLGAIDSLKRARQQDLTIRAFMDNLFRALIIFICSKKKMVNMENPKTLVKWLLSLGQDPNIVIESRHLWSIYMALGHTILSRQVDMIEPLLKAGAVARNRQVSNHPSIMSLVLPDRICDNEGAHIMRLLLGHYKLLTAEEILHAAILLQDERLFEKASNLGADVSLPIETLTGGFKSRGFNVVNEETALSTAAAVNLNATRRVFDLLQKQGQAIEAASFITPDVFISAACAGNADVISFLHEINPIGFERNARGVTPLEVAIKQGHQETYQLLFQLYRQSSPSLLLISIFTNQLEILRYLLANGIDVNLRTKRADICACEFLLPYVGFRPAIDFHDGEKSSTVSEVLIRDVSSTDNWNDGIKLLVRSGASFPAGAIHELSSAGNHEILSAALDQGGNPNEQDLLENSAVTLALRSKNTNCIQLLLERGARLQTSIPEVFEALVPEHVRNIQGERGASEPRLRALLLKHWADSFNIGRDTVLWIDAAIITQEGRLLEIAFSRFPTYYSPSSLCSAVLVENHWVIDFLVKNRSLQAPRDILEGTAVGLAAMLGNLPLVRNLVAQLQKPETALLPFHVMRSSFEFNSHSGLDITSSHAFWLRYSNNKAGRSLSEGSPLALAASYRGTSGVSELLSHGYQPDDITWARVFSMDTLDCYKALMDYNLQVRGPQPPLLTLSPLLKYAIEHEMEKAVIWLIESGADINEHDLTRNMSRSPLQFAIELGHLAITERLLRSRAKVNAPPCFSAGVTSLQCAAIKGHIGIAKQLLDAGAQVNARGSRVGGRTALEGAAESGRLNMVELLLHHGALTTGPGRFQFIRAIHFAEQYGHHATAALLRQSSEWTDEDTHLYDSICFSCYYWFLGPGPRPSGTRCYACDDDYTQRRYCCDKIHTPEDDCYHCYTEDEESHWNFEIRQRGKVF